MTKSLPRPNPKSELTVGLLPFELVHDLEEALAKPETVDTHV